MGSLADGDVSMFLVLTAACSLFSMIGLMQVHKTVSVDLYSHGLQFNYAWTVPYSNLMNFVFAMGWLNIIAAIAFQSYLINQRRKATGLIVSTEEQKLETPIEQEEHVDKRNEEAARSGEDTSENAQDENEEAPIAIGVPP